MIGTMSTGVSLVYTFGRPACFMTNVQNLWIKNYSISSDNIPKHIAVIMDGNGRWAKGKGMNRIFGHKNALTAVRETIEAAAELGTKAITLYAFSTENWNRPKIEVNALMSLL